MKLPLTSQNPCSGKCCASCSNLICGRILTGQVTLASNLNQVKNNPHPILRQKPLCGILLSSVANLPQNFPTFLLMCCGEGGLSRADLPLSIPLLCNLHGACPSHPDLSSSPTDGHTNCTCLIEVLIQIRRFEYVNLSEQCLSLCIRMGFVQMESEARAA